MPRIALVAALKREIAPLVREWTTEVRDWEGRRFEFFVRDNVIVVCGGIGAEAARRCTQAVIELYRPDQIVSVGFAGALVSELRVADVFVPAQVVDGRDGSSTDVDGGKGALVSAASVASVEGKRKLAAAYSARAVDMEAAAVARGAALRGVRFAAVKVVSDELEFEVPVVESAVTSDGRFHTGRFLLYVAVRPWLWLRVMRLGQNGRRASETLAQALRAILDASTATTNEGQ
jgi:adenosylhomocysteine nucleosidase